MIKFEELEDYPGLSSGPSVITGVLKSGKGERVGPQDEMEGEGRGFSM